MLYTVIFSLIALLLFVVIGYNIIQQYKQRVEAEKRISMSKQRAIISEVDELLLNAIKIPFSKSLLLILQNRIRNALLTMLNISPHIAAIREHLSSTNSQIKQVKENYTPLEESSFRSPENNKEALVLLQVTKKIRAILRSEHAKGKVSTEVFVAEAQHIEMIQLKINVENSIKRINESKAAEQFGSANQMINKLLTIFASIPNKDSYLQSKELLLKEYQQEIKSHLVKTSDEGLKAMQQKDTANKNDLDVLFADKKKW